MSKSTATARKLWALAKNSRKHSYAPYSQFKVGAAVRSGGQYFSGSNVENSSFGATICAERSAVCAATSKGVRRIDEVLVLVDRKDGASPCGLCLQVLREFAGPQMLVWIANPRKILRSVSFVELYPHSFGPKDLKR